MKTRSTLILAILALALGIAALWSLSSRQPMQDVGAQGPLLPGLGERLGQLEEVRILAAGDTVLATLRRAGDGWTLAERAGYPVDPSRLRSLLLALADAQRVEAKTSNPELHARLAVEDLAAADAKGAAVELIGGGEPIRLIVGENDRRGPGTFVRRADDPQSWLIDRNLAIERNPANWLQRELANVVPERIASVEVAPANGPPIRIARKADAANDFELLDLPRGRKPASDFIADATAGLLDSLRLEDVLTPDEAQEDAESLRLAHFRTQEGMSLKLRSWQSEGRTLARFEVDLDEAAATAWATAQAARSETAEAAEADSPEAPPAPLPDATGQDESGQGDTGMAKAPAEPAVTAEARLAELRDERDRLAARFANRVFVLPSYKASNLNRNLEDYLAPRD